MTRPEAWTLRRWAETWREASAALTDIKRNELRGLDTPQALDQLADAFNAALRHAHPQPTSGLIEQQRIYARLRG
jgi:hypothetical protein